MKSSTTQRVMLLWYPHIRFQRILAYKHPKTCIFTVLLVKCGSRTSMSRKVLALPHLLCDIMASAVSKFCTCCSPLVMDYPYPCVFLFLYSFSTRLYKQNGTNACFRVFVSKNSLKTDVRVPEQHSPWGSKILPLPRDH